jgi:2-dehydropantoate 2-reductase
VKLHPDELLHRVALVAKRTAVNRGSMLQDLDLGRRTEVEAIVGPIIKAAARHRIPVPLNQALYAIVRAREAAS